MKKSFLAVIATASGLLALSPTAAQATQCNGTIRALYVDSAGNLLVLPSFRGDWIAICNLTTSWSGVDPITCKSWMALATTLRVTQEAAVMNYSGTIACDAIPPYGGAPAPTYLMYYVP